MREGLKRDHAAYIAFYNISYTRNIFSIGGADISSMHEGLKADHAIYTDLLIHPTFEVPFVSVLPIFRESAAIRNQERGACRGRPLV